MGAPEEPSAQELARRLQLAHLGYGEVLDATKHQDDKVGRFLTGVAFLTTAAVAYTAGFDLASTRYRFGEWEVPLPALLALGYLLLVVVTVILLVMALGPNLRLPSSDGSGRAARCDPGSNLFFMDIADRPRDEFATQWGRGVAVADIQRRTIDNLLRETRNIATKVVFKYERTNEARAAFSFALLLLGLAVVLGGYPALAARPAAPITVGWTVAPGLGAALVAAMVTLLLGYDAIRLERGEEPKDRAKALWRLTLGAVVFVVATTGLTAAARPWAFVSLVAQIEALVVAEAAVLKLETSPTVRRTLQAGMTTMGLTGLGFTVAVAAGWAEGRLVLLGLALTVVLSLELPRVLRPWLKGRARP